MLYGVLYTFALLSLLICILQSHLASWPFSPVIWVAAGLTFLLLVNTLFLVSELKTFMAYMTVFHVAFVLIGSAHAVSALVYAGLYGLMALHFGGLALGLRRGALQFTADLQELSAAAGLGSAAVLAMASMCGLPPFVGFWAKLAVICCAATRGAWPLAGGALACGLVLMYYYMQNYRFSAAPARGRGRPTPTPPAVAAIFVLAAGA